MKWRLLIITILMICLGAPVYAERLSVSVSVANIRSGPGSSEYEILWKAEKYYPIEVFEKKGSWYHFEDFEGDKGWIHKSLVRDMPSVITKKEKCNVRSGPGTGPRHKILFTLEKGVPFKVLKREGKWIHIQHSDGDKGWIHNTLVW